MELRASSQPDRPRIPVLILVIVGSGAAGLALAHAVSRRAPEPDVASASALVDDAAPEPEGDPTEDLAARPEDPEATETEVETALVTSPIGVEDAAPDAGLPDAGVELPDAGDDASLPPPPEPVPVVADAPPLPARRRDTPEPTWDRIVRGRIAYLRCEGVTAISGGDADGVSGCPRDRDFEAQVWAAIDALHECRVPPPEPGEMDLLVDLGRGRPAEVRSRNRFAPEVVRVDPELTVACVAASLGEVTTVLDASRLVVSFRFRAR